MKERYAKVRTVSKVAYTLTKSLPPILEITASGTVPTSGWGSGFLAPRIYITPPEDGIWDFDFLGAVPNGYVLDRISGIDAREFGIVAPAWLKGVRVHASLNSLDSNAASLMKGGDSWVPYPWSKGDQAGAAITSGGNEGAQALSSWTTTADQPAT